MNPTLLRKKDLYYALIHEEVCCLISKRCNVSLVLHRNYI